MATAGEMCELSSFKPRRLKDDACKLHQAAAGCAQYHAQLAQEFGASEAAQLAMNCRERDETVDAVKTCSVTAGVLTVSLMKNVAARAASSALNVYFLADLMNEALASDKQCMQDVEGKRHLVKTYNQAVAEFTVGLQARGEKFDAQGLSIETFGAFYANDALKNISCQDLRRLLYEKEKSLKAKLGSFIAQGKLSTQEYQEAFSLGVTGSQNKIKFECLKPSVQWAVRCNLASIGILGAKAVMAPLTKKLLGLNPATLRQIDEATLANVGIFEVPKKGGLYNLFKSSIYDKDAVYLGIANAPGHGTHHYYLIAGNKRYDGSPFFTASKTKDLKENAAVAKGVIFKMNVPAEVSAKVVAAIEKNANSRNLSCLNGACNVLDDAGITIPGVEKGQVFKLIPVVRGLVQGEVRTSAGSAPVTMHANSAREVEHFLAQVRTKNQNMIERAAGQAAFKGVIVTGAVGLGAGLTQDTEYVVYKISEEKLRESNSRGVKPR
ncbi:MAG: hypothetical protein HUU57_03085 [Bdellovibrio sp.]|nr:hypothetical protein [Bdellovibrio sp.]